ncbi:unnamed protein product [Sympodiomycopsis kandeliae]
MTLLDLRSVNINQFNYREHPFIHVKASLDNDGVLTITLNRPDNLNAFTNDQGNSLISLYSLADQDPRVRVIVLTGSGTKAFCAGADLSSTNGMSTFGVDPNIRSVSDHRDLGGQVVLSMLNCRKLIIAAINGIAVGIGFTMTLAADFRLCTQKARLGTPFVKRGIACDAVSSYVLPRLIGHSRAMALILGGDLHLPTSDLMSSLFYSVHADAESTLGQAQSMAHRFANENSVVSMALCKQQVWRGSQSNHTSSQSDSSSPEYTHLHESAALAWCALHGDAKEGVKSFLEKRKPKFTTTIQHLEQSGTSDKGWYPWWTQLDTRQSKL